MMTTIHIILMQMMRHVRLQRAMKAEKLAFLTDIEGVYKDPKDPSTLISELTVSEAHKTDREMDISVAVCFRRSTTVSRLLRMGYPEFIFWMEEFHTACCLKSLQTKELVQLF